MCGTSACLLLCLFIEHHWRALLSSAAQHSLFVAQENAFNRYNNLNIRLESSWMHINKSLYSVYRVHNSGIGTGIGTDSGSGSGLLYSGKCSKVNAFRVLQSIESSISWSHSELFRPFQSHSKRYTIYWMHFAFYKFFLKWNLFEKYVSCNVSEIQTQYN